MHISAATEPGSKDVPNEDALSYSPHSVVVVDGVTSPAGLDTGCVHGTPWYARSLAGQVTDVIEREPGLDLKAALAYALQAVADMHGPECDLTAAGTPSATVAVVRHFGDLVDYLVLADATVVVDAGGIITTVTDDRLAALLGDRRAAVKAAPAGSADREEKLRELVKYQRALRNVEGGYWLAGALPEASQHALVGSVNADTVTSIAAMTDGASRLVDLFEACSWPVAMSGLRECGPAAWIERVRMIEETDPKMTLWPRYKKSDDAAIALCIPKS